MRGYWWLGLSLVAGCGDTKTSECSDCDVPQCSADGWCTMSPSAAGLSEADYTDVWGTPTGDIWAVGDGGVAHIFANGRWRCAPLNGACVGASTYHAITGTTSTVWLAKDYRVITYDGSNEMQLGTDWPSPVYDVSTAAGSALAAAVGAGIWHWSVSQWVNQAIQSNATPQPVRALWADEWAVGDAGWMAYYNAGWIWVPASTNKDLLAIGFGGDGGDFNGFYLWAVGVDGVTIRFDGDNLEPYPSGAGTLRAVWGLASQETWAVGDQGTVMRWDPVALVWTPEESGTTANLTGVWGNASAMWVVGSGGTVLRKSLE